MAQRIQSDSAPQCSRSSRARCSTEETGTRRHGSTGCAAASRNQIRAQARSSPGGWCSMPTELMEEGVGMAASAEDSQTRPRPGAPHGRLCQQGITTTEESGGHPKAPTGGSFKEAPTPPRTQPPQPPWPPAPARNGPPAPLGPP